MDLRLSDSQLTAREYARRFASDVVGPLADRTDRDRAMPATLLEGVREGGWLGAALPAEWGGSEMDSLAYGLVTEEIGRACSSVRSMLTVHNMASQALVRFGSSEQQARWLPDLCTGRKLIAFALTEPDAGSAASSIRTEARESAGSYVVSGTKVWTTFGLIADLYLVFARFGNKPMALVIERERDGVVIEPMPDVIGTRGSMLARLRLLDVEVPTSHRVGPIGAGISFVANAALDHGRFSVAWGAAGVIRACLDACLAYASKRSQSGQLLSEHQLIRRELTNMLVAHTTSYALCCRAASFRATGNPRAVMETALAKYHAAQAAVRTATDAVRLHGANGTSQDYPVERYMRDAMVLEIIEGTREVLQNSLASYAMQRPYSRS
ncbi:acyl-CoA dehydrogenase family protein [Lysobacter sp. TLK-CK17T]|uniref:Acyl-CoA dehydrogenase family protein n=1 Tax=Marilutibacter chinensis TaxID=2912247 RepID=A0ABS9I0C4_9GAMM|nr:acyl-CoA dehydrogenase family protein [Lysobacter chinensis]